MREIKFKTYHSEYGEGSVISMSFYKKTREINSDTECYAYYPKMNDSLLTSYNDVELMQYTGLKDKNGVDIYEGDILNGVYYGKAELVEKIKGEVYYTNRGTWDCCSFLLGDLNETCEVIGNIYNN